jgi:hypothetical protein
MLELLIEDCLQVIACNGPALLMLIIAMIVTYSNWQRHPAAARWAFTGFAWLFAVDVIAIVWHRVGIILVFPNVVGPNDPEEIGSMVVLSCGEALGYVFFLLALNAARTPYRPRSTYDEHDDDIDITRPRR